MEVATFRDVSLARIAAVAFHRFKIGQQVVVTAFGVHTGPYEITRLAPDQGVKADHIGDIVLLVAERVTKQSGRLSDELAV